MSVGKVWDTGMIAELFDFLFIKGKKRKRKLFPKKTDIFERIDIDFTIVPWLCVGKVTVFFHPIDWERGEFGWMENGNVIMRRKFVCNAHYNLVGLPFWCRDVGSDEQNFWLIWLFRHKQRSILA